jgi:hypothetical protein
LAVNPALKKWRRRRTQTIFLAGAALSRCNTATRPAGKPADAAADMFSRQLCAPPVKTYSIDQLNPPCDSKSGVNVISNRQRAGAAAYQTVLDLYSTRKVVGRLCRRLRWCVRPLQIAPLRASAN